MRTGHGTMDWFTIGTGVRQGCVLALCLFNLHLQYIMRNAGLDEAQTWIKVARRIINNLRYAGDTTLMTESEEEPKEPVDKCESGDWKSWLRTQHSETEVMASVNYDHNHFIDNRKGNSGNNDRLYLLELHSFCRWWLQPWHSKKKSLEEDLWPT